MDESVDELRHKGIVAYAAGDYDRANTCFEAVVVSSNRVNDHLWHGLILQLLGSYSKACDTYELVLGRDPSNTFALHHLAHIKSSCENSSIRDGKTAVEYAKRLCEISQWKDWVHVGVLAAAFAECTNWEEAIRAARLAMQLSPADEKQRREHRLNQYRKHRPFRSCPTTDKSLLVANNVSDVLQ